MLKSYLEKICRESWNKIQPPRVVISKEYFSIINLLKERNFYKTLWASCSMYDLVLSRSANGKILKSHPYVKFNFTELNLLKDNKKVLKSISNLHVDEKIQVKFKLLEIESKLNSKELKVEGFVGGNEVDATISFFEYSENLNQILKGLEKERFSL